MQKLTINTSTGPAQYSIVRRPRVTKRLHMELDECGSLLVVAPSHWSINHISTTLSLNASRVERFLVRARKLQRQSLSYHNGERHLYLGKRYPLVLKPGTKQKASVMFDGTEIQLELREQQAETIRIALQGWYLEQAWTPLNGLSKYLLGMASN